jgi:hypothetical protein
VHKDKINAEHQTLSLKNIPAGFYLFHFEKDGKVKTIKAVKN